MTNDVLFKRPVDGIASNDALSEYSDTHVFAVLEVINTIIACLLPTSSIIVLYFVWSLPARLGIIVAFQVLFSFCLALFTQARRVEIFASVAA